MQAHVEWSDDRGVISFDWGRCTLRALPGVLTLRAEAPDEDTLRRVEHRVGDRLERVGRRDQLTVTWTLPQGAGEETAETPEEDTHMTGPSRYPDSGGTPRWVKVSGIIVIVLVLLVVVMLLISSGGGGHVPRRHAPSGDPGGQTPPSSVIA